MTATRSFDQSAIIDAWYIDLSSAENNLEARDILDDIELARMRRFADAEDARRYVAAHAACRRILAACLKIPPHLVEFEITACGKPLLKNAPSPSVSFNMAHDGELALVAVGPSGGNVGADIAAVRPGMASSMLDSSVLNLAERNCIKSLPEPQRPRAVFECWTGKEAVGKALGEGLTEELSAVSIAGAIRDGSIVAGEWRLYRLHPPQGYAAALAADFDAAVRERWWPEKR